MNAVLAKAMFAARAVRAGEHTRACAPPVPTIPVLEPKTVLLQPPKSLDDNEVFLLRRENAMLKAKVSALNAMRPKLPRSQHLRAQAIIRYVAIEYNIFPEDIIGTSRNACFAMPRHIAVYFVRNMTTLGWMRMGKVFGDRNHSSVIHAYRKIQRLRSEDSEFHLEIKELESKFQHDVDAAPSARTSSSEPALATTSSPSGAGSLISEGA